MTRPTCWWCGVAPVDAIDVSTYGHPRAVLYNWPDGDHTHAVTPPTPTELADEGHRILRHILEDW